MPVFEHHFGPIGNLCLIDGCTFWFNTQQVMCILIKLFLLPCELSNLHFCIYLSLLLFSATQAFYSEKRLADAIVASSLLDILSKWMKLSSLPHLLSLLYLSIEKNYVVRVIMVCLSWFCYYNSNILVSCSAILSKCWSRGCSYSLYVYNCIQHRLWCQMSQVWRTHWLDVWTYKLSFLKQMPCRWCSVKHFRTC